MTAAKYYVPLIFALLCSSASPMCDGCQGTPDSDSINTGPVCDPGGSQWPSDYEIGIVLTPHHGECDTITVPEPGGGFSSTCGEVDGCQALVTYSWGAEAAEFMDGIGWENGGYRHVLDFVPEDPWEPGVADSYTLLPEGSRETRCGEYANYFMRVTGQGGTASVSVRMDCSGCEQDPV